MERSGTRCGADPVELGKQVDEPRPQRPAMMGRQIQRAGANEADHPIEPVELDGAAGVRAGKRGREQARKPVGEGQDRAKGFPLGARRVESRNQRLLSHLAMKAGTLLANPFRRRIYPPFSPRREAGTDIAIGAVLATCGRRERLIRMRFAKAAPRSGNRTATGSARGTSAAPEGSDFRHASEVDRPGNPASAPAAGRIDGANLAVMQRTRGMLARTIKFLWLDWPDSSPLA